jgi:acyl-homoserine-lactone acylase
LGANPKVRLSDAFALAFDEQWITAPDWVGALRFAVKARPDMVARSSSATRAALERLLSFDGQASAGSEAAADFYFWRNQASAPVARLQQGAFIAWPWNSRTFDREFATTLLATLARSVEVRQAAYGHRHLQLGDVVRVARGDADYPVGGITLDSAATPLCVEAVRAICERTMRAFGAAPYGKDGRLRVVRGSQAMRLVQFTHPLRAYSLYAFGESDDPASSHYADQTRLFSEKRMKPAYFSRAELRGHIRTEERLVMPSE